MVSGLEDSAALMTPDEEHFKENDDRYPNGAGQTAQNTGPNCESLPCLEEVVSLFVIQAPYCHCYKVHHGHTLLSPC